MSDKEIIAVIKFCSISGKCGECEFEEKRISPEECKKALLSKASDRMKKMADEINLLASELEKCGIPIGTLQGFAVYYDEKF